MRAPTIRYADHLKDWEEQIDTNEGWVCARPEGFRGIELLWRIRCAWLVFTGRMDVLAWKGGQ